MNYLNLKYKSGLVNNILLFIIHCSLFIVLVSCQKVINIDLNNAAPNIVIEGNVTDLHGPYTVKISESVNFDLLNEFPPVKGAFVKISDNTGHSDTLLETSPGIYTSKTLQGVQGGTYTLVVKVNGQTYSATSAMPNAVNIDTLKSVKSIDFRGGTSYDVDVYFHDPATVSNNYYRFIEIINGKPSNNIILFNDKLYKGEVINRTIRNEADSIYAGDSVRILLETIDPNVYEYFRELNQIVNGSGQQVSPANPLTNLSNGALGYFGAEAITSKSIIIPQ